MIRITKGAAPAILERLGKEHVRRHRRAFNRHPADYLSGERRMRIASHVYGADEVRAALIAAQHGKCCFCEVRIEHPYMHRHVEHWRPKGGVRQDSDGADEFPGYYWLAYDWDNLLLACVVCNSTFKGTCFPLADPAARARSHRDRIRAETPLLLKPDVDDPTLHIEWDDDQPRGLSPEGWKTIEVVGLIRQDDVKRTRHFQEIQQAYHRLWGIHHVDIATVREIADCYRAQLAAAVLPESPYSAMARAFLEGKPMPPP